MSIFWGRPDDNCDVRVLAVLLLSQRAHQALHTSSRTCGDWAQAEGGQLTGWPPAPAAHPTREIPQKDLISAVPTDREDAVHILASLLVRQSNNDLAPAGVRRIAELWEYLDCDAEARTWWARAAETGDEDARDYLEILLAEETEEEGTVGVLTKNPCCSHASGDVIGTLDTVMSAASVFLLPQDHCRQETQDEDRWVAHMTKRLVGEIEGYLAHQNHMTEGKTL